MKTHKDFEAYIHKTINKFVPILFLQKHTFKVKLGTEHASSYYDFIYNYPYLNQTIGYSELAFKEWLSGKDQKPYILHEICHAITDPIYSKAVQRYVSKDEIEDERERLTDHICNIILNLT
jgi:hypothetical protein